MLVGLVILITALPARSAEPSVWRSAPIWGADVRSLVIHPTRPDTVLAGTSSGQVYLSTDGGEEWRPAGPYLPFPGWVVSALVFDPNRPGRLWAGLRGVWGDGLVSVSDDLGKTWLPRVGDLPDLPIYSLALVPGLAPGQEAKLYAGTLDGVWGSENGGETWAKLSGATPEMAKVASLLVPEDRPGTVIAGTWRRVYKSEDGGRTWRGVFEGMYLDSEVFQLIPTRRPGEVWAPTCNWVYQSLDGGETWRRFVTGMDERRVTSFETLPWGRLLAGTVAGLYASDDRGRSWHRTTGPELSVQTIALHPGRPARVFLGTEGSGVWVSHDGGDTVRPSSVGMTNLRTAAVAAAGGELFLAVNHAGPASGIYVSRDGGLSFPGRAEGLPTVLDLAAEEAAGGEAVRPARVWAATERGLFERRDGVWRRVETFGERRVEEVIARDGRVVVRTRDGVWELQRTADGGERFAEATWDRGPAGTFSTGDDRYPALRVEGRSARLLAAEGPAAHLDLPIPARLVEAALVRDGRLHLATSGFGLLTTDLPAPPPERSGVGGQGSGSATPQP